MSNVIKTANAPQPKGAYSQGVIASGPQLYVSAQGPFDPTTGDVVSDSFEEQARRVFENIRAVVEAAGASMADVVKMTIYMDDPANFAAMNEIYATYFSEPYPARTPVITTVLMARIMADAVVAV